jgi:hypothetical protein
MPGLVGVVGDDAAPQSVASAADSITHFKHYCSKQSSPIRGVEIAQVWRNSEEAAGSWDKDAASDVSIYVNGAVFEPADTPVRMSAQHLLRAYLNDNLMPEDYDGSFLIAIVDGRKRQLMIFNDRLGTLPCYYFADSRIFCFAPEAKAIFTALQRSPSYSINGLITFLTLGYCLSDTTLFEAIRFLEPGTRITIDVPSVSLNLVRYWRLHFSPSTKCRSRRRAEGELYEAILAGHRTVFSDRSERYNLLLSGGWDSRGLLASVHALGNMPERSISWGLRDDLPDSDPFIAAQLARDFDVDHHFISYNTSTFIENASEWSYLTELNTDNFGWYAEGTGVLLNSYIDDVHYVLAGDECWGNGNYVRNKEEAMAACEMPGLQSEILGQCLSRHVAEDYTALYSAEVDKVLRACDNGVDSDRKDFLYLHGRVARFIFSLGYYKELAVEVRRPFFGRQVLEVIQQLPASFRYQKNLYISMLIRYFPKLLTFNEASVNSLPQWRNDVHSDPELSRYFRSILSVEALAQRKFSEYLDLDVVESMSSRFFSESIGQPVRTAKRTGGGRMTQGLRQRVAARDDLLLRLNLRKPASKKVASFDVLRRLALLSLLDTNLSRFRGSSCR